MNLIEETRWSIERAKESARTVFAIPEAEKISESLDRCLEAYREKQREPTKSLTLENGFEITNADGTPIDYEKLGKKYKDQLCYCDIDGFYIGQDGELILMDDCGKSVPIDRGDYHIYAHKPEGSETP